NSVPVPEDGNRVDDYDPATVPNENGKDASRANYCHDLEEGGVRGWRVPTLDELRTVAIHEAHRYFGVDTEQMLISSTGAGLSYSALRISDMQGSGFAKDIPHAFAICVRGEW
ncbi:MAG: hypothetical protein HY901_09810, partial [Deltaproteobacteria bacterium]|nr:hypothetical protein [Deltaproteobacteria bacterium]